MERKMRDIKWSMISLKVAAKSSSRPNSAAMVVVIQKATKGISSIVAPQ